MSADLLTRLDTHCRQREARGASQQEKELLGEVHSALARVTALEAATDRAAARMESKAREWERGLVDKGRAQSYRVSALMLRDEVDAALAGGES